VETLHDVISAMCAIAARRIRSAQRALESARRYHDAVLRGLLWLLADLEATATGADRRPTTLLLMTSEQPLCGLFNANVLALGERRFS
jgi:F0F1-type ATP synthase gamma subunit